MYILITKSNIKGQTITTIFYNKDTQPGKTVHFGATGYPDYTISPHDEER
ncbi:MAG: hypothetical protein ACKPKO_40810, partial [Candidatus Fonsibacter sp.]